MTASTPADDGPAAPPVLAIDSLRFGWQPGGDDLLVIDRLTVAAGDHVLLRGDSGCGKSSLLSLAAGVLLPGAGSVRLLGQDWRALPSGARDRRRADHIGLVFQQFNLLPYLSVLDNVLLPCRFSALRRRRAVAAAGDMAAGAGQLLEALQLDRSLWRRSAAALSVGQQQRVAAARALIGRPELILADEPTSALDEDRRDAFMALLMRACGDAGSALLFVSHDARLAPHFGRQIDLPRLNRASALQGTVGPA